MTLRLRFGKIAFEYGPMELKKLILPDFVEHLLCMTQVYIRYSFCLHGKEDIHMDFYNKNNQGTLLPQSIYYKGRFRVELGTFQNDLMFAFVYV